MAFMQPQHDPGPFLRVETSDGTDFLPSDVVGLLGLEPGQSRDATDEDRATLADYVETHDPKRISEISCESGFLCRLSAPGYMDCTSWSPCDGDDCQNCDDDDEDDDTDDEE